tara:strand:- start:341 stop:562 length:222 start_codon:yes stop_codon:yes gene_type:complete
MKKDKYQVTFLYKAVLTIDVKAENEEKAISEALTRLKCVRGNVSNTKDVNIEDDSYNPLSDGVLNMTKTWDQL